MSLKSRLAHIYYQQQHRLAKLRFDFATPHRSYLPDDLFGKFVECYSHIPAEPYQDYSDEGIRRRGKQRAQFLLAWMPHRTNTILEIGASDGFVLKELLSSGIRKAIAVDIEDALNPEVKASGVIHEMCSAEDMAQIKTRSVDFIFSYGSLEHISKFDDVMNECCRILTPGGKAYMEIGPLYYSPWGFHYYAVLNVPYIRLLFTEKVLINYAKQKRGKEYEGYMPWTNGRPYNDYYQFFRHLPSDMRLDYYRTGYDLYSAGMIIQHPDVFKAKRVPFNDFFIDGIHFALGKKDSKLI